MRELLIGVLVFVSSFLGCFQVINLAKGRRLLLSLTSCLIAISQLSIYRLAPAVDDVFGYLSYMVGGLLGANLALGWRRKLDKGKPKRYATNTNGNTDLYPH